MTAPDEVTESLIEAALCEDFDAIDWTEEPAPIPDADKLNARLGALGVAERRLADFKADAKRAQLRLEDQIRTQTDILQSRVDWLRQSLELSMAAMYAEDNRRTNVTLVNGSLVAEAGGVEWRWPDEGTDEYQRLLGWMVEHAPEAVVAPEPPPPRFDKNVAKAALKSAAVVGSPQKPRNPDGYVVLDGDEIVPELVVVEKPRKFVAKPYVPFEPF